MNYLKFLAGSSFLLLAMSCGQDGAADASSQGVEESSPTPSNETVDLSGAPSGSYVTDSGHRYITFTYDHQGYSSPYVRWSDWQGNLNWNAENPESSNISVTIDAASVDSGVDAFNDHLKSDDFFDVENYPSITFSSTGIERTGADTGKIMGELTIKNTTKPVVIDAKFNKGAFYERGKFHKLGFSGKAKVLRSDFDVDLAVPFVGDEVTIIIEAEFEEVKDAE